MPETKTVAYREYEIGYRFAQCDHSREWLWCPSCWSIERKRGYEAGYDDAKRGVNIYAK